MSFFVSLSKAVSLFLPARSSLLRAVLVILSPVATMTSPWKT